MGNLFTLLPLILYLTMNFLVFDMINQESKINTFIFFIRLHQKFSEEYIVLRID